MKYFIVVLTASLITTAFSINAEAQILDRLKKKAKNAAEQKAEEKAAEQVQLAAERMVEKSWNSIFGEIGKDTLSGKRLPFIMKSDIKTEDVYSFNTITTMEIKTIKKDGSADPPVVMDMHFNENEMYTGTKISSEEMDNKDEELFIIYDFNNSAMLMLMGNEQDKFSFAYGWEENLDNIQTAEAAEEPDWETADEWHGYSKVGSKNIMGYDCDGYRSENDDEVVEIWMSRDADFGMHSLFRANANTKQMKGKIPEDYPSGMIMEMISEDLKNGETTTMKVTNIEKNARVNYAMSDYPTMTFNSKAGKSQ